MTDFTITDWFDRELWPTYPRDLCNRIGAKNKALSSTKAKIKNRDIANTVMAGLREQMRYYRKVKAKGGHGSEWKMPMLSTWLNGEQWSNEIGSHSELKQKYEATDCACGAKANIQNFCWKCYEEKVGAKDWREEMIWAYFIKNNLGQQPGETRIDWLTRLRNKARIGYRMIG
jgi:hypothetical protein